MPKKKEDEEDGDVQSSEQPQTGYPVNRPDTYKEGDKETSFTIECSDPFAFRPDTYKEGDKETSFTIECSDPFALRVVNYWIDLATEAGLNPEVIAAATEKRNKIADWQRHNSDKLKMPD